MSKSSEKKKDLSTIKLNKFFNDNKFFLIFIFAIILLGIIVIFNGNKQTEEKVFGDDVIEMHYFFLRTCPHCIEQKKFHPTLEELYPNLKIIKHDMAKSESYSIYQEFANEIEGLDPENFPGTPLTIIGKRFNTGFGNPETTGQTLIEMIQIKQDEIDSSSEEGMNKTINLRNE